MDMDVPKYVGVGLNPEVAHPLINWTLRPNNTNIDSNSPTIVKAICFGNALEKVQLEVSDQAVCTQMQMFLFDEVFHVGFLNQ